VYEEKLLMLKIEGKKWVTVQPLGFPSGVPASEVKKGRAVLAGMAVAGATPAVSNLDAHNSVKAVLARVFRAPKYDPDPSVWAHARELFKSLFRSLTQDYVPMTVSAWLKTMPARRRAALLRAKDIVDLDVWRPSWGKFNSFIKSEKLPGFEKKFGSLLPATTMIDRLIQGPADEAHIIAGPLLKPVMVKLKEVWNNESPIFYGGVAPDLLNAWFNNRYRNGMWAVCCDYSMYDNSHSDCSWNFMWGLYNKLRLFELDPRFSLIFEAWRRPVGRMTGKGWALRYQAPCMNASGRDDTALANGLLNGVVFYLSAMAARLEKSVLDLSVRDLRSGLCWLSVCGDDSLCLLSFSLAEKAYRDAFVRRLSTNISSFGFDASAEKMSVTDNPFNMVYLAMRPYPAQGRWWFGRTIGRAIWKMGWVLDGVGLDCPARVTGDCEAIAITQAVVPVLYDHAVGYLKSRVGCKRLVPAADPNRPWTTGVQTPLYEADTLMYVAQGYDLTLRELVELCDQLRSISSYPCVVDNPALIRIVTYDDL
jgi:hypothetical protein